MPVDVSTEVFEGPLDLLLQLILQEEVDLYEVSLASIVDAYLSTIDQLIEAEDGLDLEVATEFLLIAATLVELKTRRLLPDPEGDEFDESIWLWEERDLLLSRLIECKTFKNVAERVESLLRAGSRTVPRRTGLDERFLAMTPDLLGGVGPDDLARAFVRATRPRPVPEVSLHHVTPITASVSDALARMARTLPYLGSATFRELTVDTDDRIEIVVRFLAVLELYKEGLVDLEQATTFGELTVRWMGGGHSEVDVDLVLAGADRYDG
ncbi:MAG: ScpA family protein [Actinomycetota bacterium]